MVRKKPARVKPTPQPPPGKPAPAGEFQRELLALKRGLREIMEDAYEIDGSTPPEQILAAIREWISLSAAAAVESTLTPEVRGALEERLGKYACDALDQLLQPRGSGKTQKLLEEALEMAGGAAHVIILAASHPERVDLCDRFRELAGGVPKRGDHLVHLRGTVFHFLPATSESYATKALPNDAVRLIDHHAFENAVKILTRRKLG